MALEVGYLPFHPDASEALFEQLPHARRERTDSQDLLSIGVRVHEIQRLFLIFHSLEETQSAEMRPPSCESSFLATWRENSMPSKFGLPLILAQYVMRNLL